MHGLLPAKAKRRTRLLAAVLAAAAWPAAIAAGVLASAVPAQASPDGAAAAGGVSVAIDAMSPAFAGPGATVRLSGTVTNGTRQAQAGLYVQLYASASHFTTRDGMASFLSRGAAPGLAQAGLPFYLSASVAPGATVTWTASFQVSTQGIGVFGVYPVIAQLQDFAGGVLSSGHTLLPFWPGSRAAGLARPLKISWLWPLIDQPHHQVCLSQTSNDLLTSNDLAASLDKGGRLGALLAIGAAHADARLTWVVDPALLSDAETMAGPHRISPGPGCEDVTAQPASKAAAAWLAALRQVTSGQPTVITPYANADMTALDHQGLTRDLASAYSTGDAVADSVLHGKFGHTVAWPPGGTADLSVLTNLAAIQHVNTVVLNSSEMRPADPTVFQPDDAVTSLRVAGLPMTVLLSDDTLTGVLEAANTGSGVLPKSTEFAVGQRFLAETAMIAAEEPNSARTVVVAPPQDWSPPPALAGGLLAETASAPWLAPTPLAGLSSAPDTQRTVLRRPPPASKASPGELSRGYLSQPRALGPRLGRYKSMLYKPPASYTQSLEEALLATESAAWRGSGAAQGQLLAGSLKLYLKTAESKVKIIRSVQVPMGGASGLVPVNVQNGLRHAIQVRVVASVVNSPGRTSQLTIGHFPDLVTVPPQQPVTVRLPVNSAPQGSTQILLSLTSANGTPLPFTKASLTVLSTRYGRAILFLIGAAIGVLVLTSVYRGVRRWLHDDTRLVDEEADPPGSVVTGTGETRDPTEAPDDLADARRWVDDA